MTILRHQRICIADRLHTRNIGRVITVNGMQYGDVWFANRAIRVRKSLSERLWKPQEELATPIPRNRRQPG